MVEQLQQQLQVQEAELQRKSAELLQKEAKIQRLAQEQCGKNCAWTVWLWGILGVACGEWNSEYEYHFGAGPECVLLI